MSVHNRITKSTVCFVALVVYTLFLVSAAHVYAAPPIDLSSVNEYNQISFGDANLTDSNIAGNVVYVGNGTFTNTDLATSFFADACPSGTTRVQVGGDVTYNSGTVFGGNATFGTGLSQGTQTFWCNQSSWQKTAPTVNTSAAQSTVTALSTQLSTIPASGPLSKNSNCAAGVLNPNSDLHVVNIDEAVIENTDDSRLCTFVIQANCSATVIINVSGTEIDLTNFDLNLGSSGIAPSQVLINFFEATTINLSGAQFSGTVMAPLATVNADVNEYNRIIGGLFANEINGRYNMEEAPFVAGPQAGCERQYDYGDLPANYAVDLLENGARHEIGDLKLGMAVDAETDGQASPAASADGSDEDGVQPVSLASWSTVNGGTVMAATMGGDGCLNGWVDWNNDGDFADAGEQIITNELVATTGAMIDVDVQYVPAGATRFARYRVTEPIIINSEPVCADTVMPTGLEVNGEVEDYQYIFADATAVTLNSAETTTTSLVTLLAATMTLLGGTFITVKRR